MRPHGPRSVATRRAMTVNESFLYKQGPLTSWADVCAAQRPIEERSKLDFYEPIILEGKKMVIIPHALFQRTLQYWGAIAVYHLVGESLALEGIKIFSEKYSKSRQ